MAYFSNDLQQSFIFRNVFTQYTIQITTMSSMCDNKVYVYVYPL